MQPFSGHVIAYVDDVVSLYAADKWEQIHKASTHDLEL